MDNQLLLQWLGQYQRLRYVNDTKKAGEIGEAARRAEGCLGNNLGSARHAYSKQA